MLKWYQIVAWLMLTIFLTNARADAMIMTDHDRWSLGIQLGKVSVTKSDSSDQDYLALSAFAQRKFIRYFFGQIQSSWIVRKKNVTSLVKTDHQLYTFGAGLGVYYNYFFRYSASLSALYMLQRNELSYSGSSQSKVTDLDQLAIKADIAIDYMLNEQLFLGYLVSPIYRLVDEKYDLGLGFRVNFVIE